LKRFGDSLPYTGVGQTRVIADRRHEFVEFTERASTRLRPVLVAHYGVETANDLCADAIAYAWEHWDRVRGLDNPVGYLYRVATSRARQYQRWRRPLHWPLETAVAVVEPDNMLNVMLARLPLGQRTAVVLVHVYGWSYQDVADVIGRSRSDVRNDVHRGLAALRARMEAGHGR
jgi:RNA polymerase sigma factor (sigma-70 family)